MSETDQPVLGDPNSGAIRPSRSHPVANAQEFRFGDRRAAAIGENGCYAAHLSGLAGSDDDPEPKSCILRLLIRLYSHRAILRRSLEKIESWAACSDLTIFPGKKPRCRGSSDLSSKRS